MLKVLFKKKREDELLTKNMFDILYLKTFLSQVIAQ